MRSVIFFSTPSLFVVPFPSRAGPPRLARTPHTRTRGVALSHKHAHAPMGLLDAARAAIERNMEDPAARDAWGTAYTRRVDAARQAL